MRKEDNNNTPVFDDTMDARSIELLVLTLMSAIGEERIELRVDDLQMHKICNNHVKATVLNNGNLLYEIDYGGE